MLETTRQFNQERLTEDKNADAIHRSHAEYFTELVERAMGEYSTSRHGYWYARLKIEYENIRSAFDWSVKNNELELSLRLACAPRRYWRNYGIQKDGLLWAETALELAKQAPVSLRGRALMSAGDYCIDLDQVEKGKGYLNEALEIFKQLDDQKNIAWCMALIGVAFSNSQDDIAKGIKLIRASFNIFQQLNDLDGLTHAYTLLGEMARMGEDYEMAEHYYNKCLELAKETGERVTEGIQYANLGMLAKDGCVLWHLL
jgi:tetratricopeptide (TPR) repeat protein